MTGNGTRKPLDQHGYYAFVGHVRGGLAVATSGGCAGFGAVCGSSIATATTMTRAVMPEMNKRNYSERLSTGSITAGGTLGMLIPPSIILVLYGVLTEQCVKTLFVAALIPALLSVVLYVVTIGLIVRRNPELGPPGDAMPLHEAWAAVVTGWAAILLMIAVTGGIYTGAIFDTISSMVITIPFVFPLIVGYRFDPIW